MEQQPLIDKDILLERFQAKGGWTFARLPEIPQDKRNYFGSRKVRGFIDSYEIKHCTLLPMGKGLLFLPVKAEIRKKIGKQEGDYVRVVLYADIDQPTEVVPEDFMECLRDEPAALKTFQQLPKAAQKACLQWLMEVSVTQTRIQRMADAIDNLAAGRPFYAARKG